MNSRKTIALLLLTLLPQFAAAAEAISWQGKTLTEVRSMGELPPDIRARFDMDTPTPAGVADIGKPFNSGDVTIQGWPSRGLVGAAHNADTWILAIAHGSNMGGVAVVAYVIEDSALVMQERVGYMGSTDAFAKIVNALNQPPRPRAQLGGIAIDDSQQQVETTLGKPTEIVAHERTYIGDPARKPTNLRITQELRYPGLSIWLRDTIGAMEVIATGGNYCQTGRICVGATAATVRDELQQLGIAGSDNLVPNTTVYFLRHETQSCQADVGFTSGVASSIRVRCRG